MTDQLTSETYCDKHGVNLVQSGGRCALCERGVEDLRPSKAKLCIVCHDGPREVPDRNSMSPAKKVCRKCHGKRLKGDMCEILRQQVERRR